MLFGRSTCPSFKTEEKFQDAFSAAAEQFFGKKTSGHPLRNFGDSRVDVNGAGHSGKINIAVQRDDPFVN